MNRKAQELKTLLLRIVNTQKQDLTGLVSNPDIDFSRNRKIPYEKMILSLLTMEGTTLTNELLRQLDVMHQLQHHLHLYSNERKYFRLHSKNFFKILFLKHLKMIHIRDIDF